MLWGKHGLCCVGIFWSVLLIFDAMLSDFLPKESRGLLCLSFWYSLFGHYSFLHPNVGVGKTLASFLVHPR